MSEIKDIGIGGGGAGGGGGGNCPTLVSESAKIRANELRYAGIWGKKKFYNLKNNKNKNKNNDKLVFVTSCVRF